MSTLTNPSSLYRVEVPSFTHLRPNTQIVYLRGSVQYTYIYYEDGQVDLMSYSIKRLSALRPNLLRVHKGYAVNPAYIVNIRHANLRDTDLTVQLNNKQIIIPVSRRQAKVVISALRLSWAN
ncbi:LytTR family DNA-binding domain-containing protein [Spirosoma endbachense]|uniref:LytTR family DNA-binding domain-containing protein n=1 Tax=Spirosoma endbachense TaxID=2666025 RepID=UPI001390B536|nr:LytTR family DNA-binding domain-containing protein [Spirosoma endbachense]